MTLMAIGKTPDRWAAAVETVRNHQLADDA